MVSWSALGRSFGTNLIKFHLKTPNNVQNVKFSTTKLLNSEHKTFAIQPSRLLAEFKTRVFTLNKSRKKPNFQQHRWQWHKFKDMMHFYVMVGLIPVSAIIFYTNVFIGPAQLTPIPKDYNPKYWEYHRHPISRFIARYIHNNPQQEYEKFLHYIDEEQQKRKLRELEKQIKQKMAERQDYQAYYYRPMVNKYLRINKKTGDDVHNRIGDDYTD